LIREGGLNSVSDVLPALRTREDPENKEAFLTHIGLYPTTGSREQGAGSREEWGDVREKTGKIVGTRIARHKDVSFATLLSAQYRRLSFSFRPICYFHPHRE
jgi:hypothetical protein